MGCRVVSLLLAFSVALMVAALGTIAQSQTPPGTWTQKAPMPAVRGEVAAAAVGDKLFALGGGGAGGGRRGGGRRKALGARGGGCRKGGGAKGEIRPRERPRAGARAAAAAA